MSHVCLEKYVCTGRNTHTHTHTHIHTPGRQESPTYLYQSHQIIVFPPYLQLTCFALRPNLYIIQRNTEKKTKQPD